MSADSITMCDTLQQTLARVMPDLQKYCCDPWYLIGSAAASLAGADVSVADLDVLASADDAARLEIHWRYLRDPLYAPAGAERFRSRFARFRFPGLPLEVMGGLELHGDDGWQPVQVHEAASASVAGFAVPIPSVAEQIRILESFGRPKDLQRAALLKALNLPLPNPPLSRGD